MDASYRYDIPDDANEIIGKARFLLDFSANLSIPVPDAAIQTVLAVGAASRSDSKINVAQETQLRLAYRQICEALHPATIDSIIDTHGRNPANGRKIKPKAPSHVFWYGLIALFSLLIAIGVQIFWVTGASLTKDVSENLKQYDRLSQEIIRLEHGFNTEESQTLAEDGIGALNLDQKYSEMESVFSQLEANKKSLNSWNMVWSQIMSQTMYVFFQFQTPLQSDIYGNYDPASQARVDVASAKLVLQAVASYILPMLFGLLGACILVIRRVSSQIKAHTFVAESRALNFLRLALGPLAGVAIGLIVVPDISKLDPTIGSVVLVFETLSPVTLAFVAGYGVELLFALMDRIVFAFVKPEPEGPAQPRGQPARPPAQGEAMGAAG